MSSTGAGHAGTLPARAILAAVLVGVGLLLVWRGMSRFSPPSTRPTPSAQPTAQPTALNSLAAESSLETQPSSLSAEGFKAQVIAATTASATHAGVPPPVAEQLATSTGEYLAAISTASFEGYLRFVEDRGGRQDLNLSDPTQSSRLRSYFESVTKPYSGQPLSLESLVVRPRVLRGGNVAQQAPPGFRVFGQVTSDSRFPQLQPVSRMTDYGHVISSDTYEVAFPVRHALGGESTVVWIGLWYTRVPESASWLPSRIVVYEPIGRSGQAGPLFSPPL